MISLFDEVVVINTPGLLIRLRNPDPRLMKELVTLRSLGLEEGDTVVTPKGAFLVLERLENGIEAVWLESNRRDYMCALDNVYGPAEVLRKGSLPKRDEA